MGENPPTRSPQERTEMLTSYEFTKAWILSRGRRPAWPERRGLRGDRGSGLLEYAVLVVLLAVVCMGAVALLSRASQGRTTPITTTTSVP
jgi:Flp pilus assembly pilin Flp